MIQVGILGSTGYAGGELVRLLSQHGQVKLNYFGTKSYVGKEYTAIYQNLYETVDGVCSEDNIGEMARSCDVIFTATPQGLCASILTEELLQKTKVIDLSADFRFKDVKVYEEWYGRTHENPGLVNEAVYGLCEINRDLVKTAKLVANPGCYTTCSILTIYPLIKEQLIDASTLIIDAKSGVSGAGRGAKVGNLYCEVNENIKAYGVSTHRHTPEIEEQLGYALGKPVLLNFTPHLVPMNRGILVTAYAGLKDGVTEAQVREVYQTYYRKEPFIRLLRDNIPPETRFVEGGNFVDINAVVDKRTNRVIMMGALDNLVKGAAGQAVQNMNLMFGYPENMGLQSAPMFP